MAWWVKFLYIKTDLVWVPNIGVRAGCGSSNAVIWGILEVR